MFTSRWTAVEPRSSGPWVAAAASSARNRPKCSRSQLTRRSHVETATITTQSAMNVGLGMSESNVRIETTREAVVATMGGIMLNWWNAQRARAIGPKAQEMASSADDPAARLHLAALEARTYRTYRSRESACSRLGKRARAWNGALVALATSTTIASIGMLTDEEMYGTNGSALLVCLAVLALVASLTTTNLDYAGRSRDMFLNYRKIQRISVEMEELRRQSREPVTMQLVRRLSDRYQAVLDETENHTEGDHLRHFSRTLGSDHPYFSVDETVYRRRRRAIATDFAITSFPYATLALPVSLLVPLVRSLLP